ncbi:hypothetical protein ACFL2V_11115 [Pseudomonadota bacterium]
MADSNPPPSRPPEAQTDEDMRPNAKIMAFPINPVPDFGDQCKDEVADGASTTKERIENVVPFRKRIARSARGRIRASDKRGEPRKSRRRYTTDDVGELGRLITDEPSSNTQVDSIMGGKRSTVDSNLLKHYQVTGKTRDTERLVRLLGSIGSAIARPEYVTGRRETSDVNEKINTAVGELVQFMEENRELLEKCDPTDDALFHPVGKILLKVWDISRTALKIDDTRVTSVCVLLKNDAMPRKLRETLVRFNETCAGRSGGMNS